MLLLYRATTPWILNFPTKDHWKQPARLEFIELGLAKFADTYEEKGITFIAFPKLGTQSGGLEWEAVRPLMYRYLELLATVVFAVIVLNHNLPRGHELALTAACTVILSILAHGFSANPLSALLGAREAASRAE